MLDKLYITPKQWMHVLRWTLYTLLLLLAMMVQTVVLGNRTIFGIHPDFVPVIIVCVCMREGPERGGTFALLGSLLWCLSGVEQGSICVAVLTIVPVLGGLVCRAALVNRFVPCLIVTVFALFLEHLIAFLIGFFFNGMAGILFLTDVLPCVLISSVVQPLVYLVVKRIEKVGDAYESI